MSLIIILALLLTFTVILGAMYAFKTLAKADNEGFDMSGTGFTAEGLGYALIVFAFLFVVGSGYWFLQGTPWEGHMMEWMNIVVRIMHMTFGIAWIGASFYFVFLENALNRTHNVRDELAGNLWAVHGGGFYYLEKYKVAPKEIPKDLHWFKYEAYFTWLSGISLLFVVYYFNARANLIDTNVLDITPIQGISIGIGSFIMGWMLYGFLSRTELAKKGLWFALLGFLLLTGFAWFYCHVFSARAAYIHFGALIGTLMVGNVFFVIIPAQKAMVAAAKLGEPVNPAFGKHALLRSLHNNYFTLPVLFVMVSNHFPSTFGSAYPWATLAGISLGVAGIKHWLNQREKHQTSVWVLPVSIAVLLVVAFVTGPKINPAGAEAACTQQVGIGEVQAIVQQRCMACHSSNPTDDVYRVAPNGLKFDSPQDIINQKDKIMQRVVVTKTMPQLNKTHMTDEERNVIRCCIERGAKL
jgi:uncharacterized membrane protein